MFVKLTQILKGNKSEVLININNIVDIEETDFESFKSHIQTVSDDEYYNVLESMDEIIEKIQKARERDPLAHTINWLGSHISLLRETMESQKQCDCGSEPKQEPKINVSGGFEPVSEQEYPISQADPVIWRTTPAPKDGTLMLANFTPLTHPMHPNEMYFVFFDQRKNAWFSGSLMIDKTVYGEIIDPTRWIPFSDLQKIGDDRRG